MRHEWNLFAWSPAMGKLPLIQITETRFAANNKPFSNICSSIAFYLALGNH